MLRKIFFFNIHEFNFFFIILDARKFILYGIYHLAE